MTAARSNARYRKPRVLRRRPLLARLSHRAFSLFAWSLCRGVLALNNGRTSTLWLTVWIALASLARSAGADLALTVQPRWGRETLVIPSTALANQAGQTLRITRLDALISSVTLFRADGGVVRLDGQFGFISAGQSHLTTLLRSVPLGDYAGIEFQLGVPPAINHADPAQWSAGHPLNPLVNGLHWGWQGGYVFSAIEGRWRETDSGPDSDERGFSYHLATDARLMTVGFCADFQIAGDTTLTLALDLARVLGAQKFSANDGSASTHSAEGDPVAARLATALERAWFWLGAAPTPPQPVAATPVSATVVAAPTTTPHAFTVPAGFPQPTLPADNPLTNEGIALGERLFFDARLSSRGAQSCASCHAPERAFSDAVAFSPGENGSPGVRNAMPLFNLAWAPNYAWDGSQARIRDQARAAWTNPLEMNATPGIVTAALAGDASLVAEFAAVFGTPEITAERVTLALEQYLLTLVSADSRFDRSLRSAAVLSDEEKRGFALFATEFDPARGRRGADCFHCHGGMLFTDFMMKSNGLDLLATDPGRARVTGSAPDAGAFKTPSLRNVALTGPYMHDGRFTTLEEVVAHYDHGVRRADNLDPNLAKHPNAGLELSADDQRALVAFLRSLTDARFEPAASARQSGN